MLLTLFSTSTFAQPPTIMRRDRQLASSGFPRYRKGRDFNVPFIEVFKNGGDKEAKRWWKFYPT